MVVGEGGGGARRRVQTEDSPFVSHMQKPVISKMNCGGCEQNCLYYIKVFLRYSF